MSGECADVLNALPSLAADEMTAEGRETIQRHLADCAACRDARARLESGRRLISGWDAPTPPDGLVERTMARIAIESPTPAAPLSPDSSRPAARAPFRFSLVDSLVAASLVLVTVGILIPTLATVEKSAKKKECQKNLERLAQGLAVYVDKFGGGREYPAMPGSSFWNALRRIPSPEQSLMTGEHGAFVCTVLGTSPNRISCDYRGPSMGRTFPVSLAFEASRIIGSDRTTNHDPSGTDDINVLLIDGRVEIAPYGSALWARAEADTAN